MFTPTRRFLSTLRNRPVAAGAVLILLFATLYAVTLDNGLRPDELAGGDLITHQYAQVQGRPSNAPGYPLYTMGGWLWFRMGRALFGSATNPIPLLSAYSTLWALIALALLYALILECLGSPRRWPIAFVVTTFYGLTYFFWYYAVTTEQYTSSVAWTVAACLLAFKWERSAPRDERYLLALAFLTGVGLAHQVTVLLAVPPLLWFVLRCEPGLLRRPRLLLAAAFLALLPLTSYAYVFVRGSQHPEWRGAGQWESDWHWFLTFLSTGQGRSELTWSWRPFLTAEFPALIWQEMTWPGLLLGLVGLGALPRRRAVTFYAILALYLVFSWLDRLGNWFQVIMPAYALLAVGIAGAAGWLWERAGGHSSPAAAAPTASNPAPAPVDLRGAPIGRTPGIVRGAILTALIALALYRGLLSLPRADASNRVEDVGLLPGWAMIADHPPPETAVFATQAEALALNYLVAIWGIRPDLRTVTSEQAAQLLPEPGFAATEAVLPLVPVEISPEARFSALGRTLVAIGMKDKGRKTDDLLAWEHDFGEQVRLVGGRVGVNPATGETVVLLAWEPGPRLDGDWAVSVRLAQDGDEIAQVDRAQPVFGAYPMSRWQQGEVVLDAYPFHLPPGVEPDEVAVILYRPTADGFENLDVFRHELHE